MRKRFFYEGLFLVPANLGVGYWNYSIVANGTSPFPIVTIVLAGTCVVCAGVVAYFLVTR